MFVAKMSIFNGFGRKKEKQNLFALHKKAYFWTNVIPSRFFLCRFFVVDCCVCQINIVDADILVSAIPHRIHKSQVAHLMAS
jgi:hypothetical protein